MFRIFAIVLCFFSSVGISKTNVGQFRVIEKTTTGSQPASVLSDVQSTTRTARLCPQMTGAQKRAIASPVTGACVFDTDGGEYESYNGTGWVSFWNTSGASFGPLVGSVKTIQIFSGSGSGPGRPIVVSAVPATNGLMIVRGRISSGGLIASGEGFSVALITSVYTVTFTTAFLDIPACTAAVEQTSFGAGVEVVAISSILASSVSFIAGSSSSGLTNANFQFICIGQRL